MERLAREEDRRVRGIVVFGAKFRGSVTVVLAPNGEAKARGIIEGEG